jgi:hypothetical protein
VRPAGQFLHVRRIGQLDGLRPRHRGGQHRRVVGGQHVQVGALGAGGRPQPVEGVGRDRPVGEQPPVGVPDQCRLVVADVPGGRPVGTRDRDPGQEVRTGRVGQPGHLVGATFGGQRGARVVQRDPAADGAQPVIRVDHRQLAVRVGGQLQRLGGDPPAPRLGVEDRRGAQGRLGGRPQGFGVGRRHDLASLGWASSLPCRVRIPDDQGRRSRHIGFSVNPAAPA